mmetsp:Transcript_45292/g.98481  ORF Transcript_45292/g.98481 Transcript_45292/m.98481 type:complete len:329 (+) Transcript_45292:72-1058(+)
MRSTAARLCMHAKASPGPATQPAAGAKKQALQLPRRRPNTAGYVPGAFAVPPPVKVPAHIPRPSYANDPHGRPRKLREEEWAEVKGSAAIDRMRDANRLAAEALALACETAVAGVTTDEVDRRVSEYVISRGAYPVGINYCGFPRGLCASPNEVALHGIPNTRPLEDGDIVSFDVTVFLNNAFGDNCATVCVGDVDEDARRLVEVSRQCLLGAIEVVGPGVRLNSVGRFCDRFARERGFGVVSEFCGHFIGSELHMNPNVLHVPNKQDLELKPGMTFTIEPILVEGEAKIVGPLDDNWTILSHNGGWSAQWEHTLLITDNGVEILSQA